MRSVCELFYESTTCMPPFMPFAYGWMYFYFSKRKKKTLKFDVCTMDLLLFLLSYLLILVHVASAVAVFKAHIMGSG
jgi:hypothetical protein